MELPNEILHMHDEDRAREAEARLYAEAVNKVRRYRKTLNGQERNRILTDVMAIAVAKDPEYTTGQCRRLATMYARTGRLMLATAFVRAVIKRNRVLKNSGGAE